MWPTASSSLVISADHLNDIEIRTHIFQLWNSLPKNDRDTWRNHPDFSRLGEWFCFWKDNYFRWRQKFGPILRYPEPDWLLCPSPDEIEIEAIGDTIAGRVVLGNTDCFGTCAFAFYSHRRGTVFGSGLKSLTYVSQQTELPFRFSGLKRGWKRGLIYFFNSAGYLLYSNWMPAVFCR